MERDLVTSRRLFVALELPPDLQHQLVHIQESLKPHFPLARWVDVSQTHLTLKFLDQVAEDKRFDLEATLAMVAHGHAPFPLAVGAVDFAPNHGMIWMMAVPEPSLLALHHDLDSNLRPLGFLPERREFFPHITLARLGQGYNGEIPFMVTWPGYRLEVNELVLYESHLAPPYTVLGRYRLGEGATTPSD